MLRFSTLCSWTNSCPELVCLLCTTVKACGTITAQLDFRKSSLRFRTQPMFFLFWVLGHLIAAQEKADRFIKEFCIFSKRILPSCPTGPRHRNLSPATSPGSSVIHTNLDAGWLQALIPDGCVFSHRDYKIPVMDTCEGHYGDYLVSPHPPAA